jgi:hypothetical protein
MSSLTRFSMAMARAYAEPALRDVATTNFRDRHEAA